MELTFNKIQENCNQLKEELQKQEQILVSINLSVAKLRSDRKITEANIFKLSGALQAMSQLLKGLEASNQQEAPNK